MGNLCVNLKKLCGVLIFTMAFSVEALPVVESRTGTPVVRGGAGTRNSTTRELSNGDQWDVDPAVAGENTFHGHAPTPQNTETVNTSQLHNTPKNTYQPIENSPRSNTSQSIEPSRKKSHAHKAIETPHVKSPESRAASYMTLNQVEALQKEVIELRGQVELQDHEMKQLKKSQQDLYKDLDRRLAELAQKPSQNKETESKMNIKAEKSSEVAKQNTAAKNIGVEKQSVAAKNSAAEKPKKESSHIKEERILDSVDAKNEIVVDQLDEETEALRNSTNNITVKTDQEKKAKSSLYDPDQPTVGTLKKNKNTDVMPEAKTLGIITPKSASNDDQTTYQTAYNLIKSKKYPDAATAFSHYLKQFPKGKEAPNAHYWLGEIYMLQWQEDKSKMDVLEKASQEFSNIVHQYPEHLRVADAILKLGLIELDKGNNDVAKLHFTDVKTRFPKSSAARVAEAKLQSR